MSRRFYVEAQGGENFYDAVRRAKSRSLVVKHTTTLIFNGVFIRVKPSSSDEKLHEYYRAVLLAKREKNVRRDARRLFRHAVCAIVYAPLFSLVWTNDKLIDALRAVRRWAYECDSPF